MIKKRGRILKELYPAILLATLLMTWGLSTHGLPRGNVQAHEFRHEWSLSKGTRAPASVQACRDSDLSWIAAHIKKWEQKHGAKGGNL